VAAPNVRSRVEIKVPEITRFFTTEPAPQAGLMANAQELQTVAEDLTPKGKSLGQFRQRGGPGGHPIGPFGEPYPHGFARVSYHVRKFRGGFRMYSRDWYINVIEYGSTKNPPYAPMRRAMRAVGGARAKIHASKTSGSQAIEGEHTGGMF
jgi:hypothetical protein